MSGGCWNYQYMLDENYHIKDISKIIDALEDAFHVIDWAESGDTNRKDAEPQVYDILLELGDQLWGDPDH